MAKKIYIGITGRICSGKDSVGNAALEWGKEFFGSSTKVTFHEAIVKELEELGLEEKRENLQLIGDSRRKEFGLDYFSKKVMAMAKNSDAKVVVITGIRNPGEISSAKNDLGALVLGVDANPEIRLRRYLKRARPDDILTKKAFSAADKREEKGDGKVYGLRIGACMKLVDKTILNEGTLEQLKENVYQTLDKHFRSA